MATSGMSDAVVLAICIRMEAKMQRVRVETTTLRVGQHVRISNQNMKFAKAAEHNFRTEIFRIVSVIHRRPRAVYDLEYLNDTQIDGQF